MAKSFDALVKRTTSQRTQARAVSRTQELLAEMLLSETRQSMGLSQSEVALTLGIKQPSLSKLEKQTDMQISTLDRLVKALGGELEVVAKFPRGDVRLIPFGKANRRITMPRLKRLTKVGVK